MTNFWRVTEDPSYDEDGVLIDEDADFKEIKEEMDQGWVKILDRELEMP